eukprot:3012168-Rhodomonas_salina.1
MFSKLTPSVVFMHGVSTRRVSPFEKIEPKAAEKSERAKRCTPESAHFHSVLNLELGPRRRNSTPFVALVSYLSTPQ